METIGRRKVFGIWEKGKGGKKLVKKNIWPGGGEKEEGKGVKYFAWRRRTEERRKTFGEERRWIRRKIVGLDKKKNKEGKRGKYIIGK